MISRKDELRWFFFFSSRRRHTRLQGDWSSDVCSSDLILERSEDLREREHALDGVVERIIRQLDLSFITPFDREDIHTLATSLDDVLDNMEETAHRLEVFRIEQPTAAAVSLARIIHECCVHLEH